MNLTIVLHCCAQQIFNKYTITENILKIIYSNN